ASLPGAPLLRPLLTGSPPATTLLVSALRTLLSLAITANTVPRYLGASCAFTAPIAAAIEAASMGAALGGVMITGLLLAALGLLVARIGTSWITLLMRLVVMGSIVALIGFNLAPTAYENFQQSAVTATVTLFAV